MKNIMKNKTRNNIEKALQGTGSSAFVSHMPFSTPTLFVEVGDTKKARTRYSNGCVGLALKPFRRFLKASGLHCGKVIVFSVKDGRKDIIEKREVTFRKNVDYIRESGKRQDAVQAYLHNTASCR